MLRRVDETLRQNDAEKLRLGVPIGANPVTAFPTEAAARLPSYGLLHCRPAIAPTTIIPKPGLNGDRAFTATGTLSLIMAWMDASDRTCLPLGPLPEFIIIRTKLR